MSPFVIAALYHFVTLENIEELREGILAEMLDRGVRGTILIANEGINGTIAMSGTMNGRSTRTAMRRMYGKPA